MNPKSPLRPRRWRPHLCTVADFVDRLLKFQLQTCTRSVEVERKHKHARAHVGKKIKREIIWLKLNEIKDLLPDLEARSGWCHSQALEAIHNSSWRGEKVTSLTTHVHMACGFSNQLTSIWPQYLRGGSQLRYSSRIFKTKNPCSYVAYVVTNKMLKSNVPSFWSSSCSSQPEGLCPAN